jgi:hypothetical protein
LHHDLMMLIDDHVAKYWNDIAEWFVLELLIEIDAFDEFYLH